ncbi:hypothetical protein D3C78_1014740 [compost metagenome]
MPDQFWPEQHAQAEQPQRTAHQHIARDALTKEHPRIQRVPQRRGGKHHRDQTAGDPLTGGQETHEVDAKQAQALRHADQMPAAVHRLQAPTEQQQRKQHQRGEPEAIDDRHRNRHHAKLPFQGNPGGAPDQHGQQIQRQVHGRHSSIGLECLPEPGLCACRFLRFCLAAGWQRGVYGVGCKALKRTDHGHHRYPASLSSVEQLAERTPGAQRRAR